jgi:hypothetical protein
MQRKMQLFFILLTNLSLIFSTNLNAKEACHKDFLVIDVGSSTTKGFFYKKDLCNGNKTIEKKSFNYNYPYQACLSESKSQTLPRNCIDGGINGIAHIKSHFNINCTDNCFAFATGWARYIDNKDEWLDSVGLLKVQPQVVSQKYEGELKLIALKERLADKPFIGFDIGGGSFQLVWQGSDGIIHHYNSPYGTDNFTYDIQDKLLSERAKACVKARNNLNILREGKAEESQIKKAIKDERSACGKNCTITFSKQKLDEAIAYGQEKIGKPLMEHEELQKFIRENKPTVYADTLLVNLGIKKQLGLNKESITSSDLYKIMMSVSGMEFVEIKSTYPDLPDICVNTTQPAMLILYTIINSLGVNEIYGIETDYIESFVNLQLNKE